MEKQENMGGGTSYILTADDSLAAVPDSHQDIISPEIRIAFTDPIAYFRAAADRCRFPKMAEWLYAVTEIGKWRLVLEEGFMMDRSTQGGFFLISTKVTCAVISPPETPNPSHDLEAFAHYYSLVDSIHWGGFAFSGGLFGYGQPFTVAHFGVKSKSKAFAAKKTFVWGNTECGDVLVYNSEGQLGFLSHENGSAYSLGTIDEGINWVFDEFLHERTPEFDYKRAKQ